MARARPRIRVDPRTRPPRPWVAAALTLLAPGLGHAYAGAWSRSAAVWAGGFALALFLLGPPRSAEPGLVALAAALYLGWAMLDAARLARRHPRTRLRRFNRWFVYLPLALAAGGALSLAALAPP